MLTFEPFRPGHLKYINPEAVQTEDYRYLMTAEAAGAIDTGPAISAWASGTCLGAAGIVLQHSERGEAWMVLSGRCKPYLKPILRQIRYALDSMTLRRIDMSCVATNRAGIAIARVLKFEFEARLEAFHMTGEDMLLFKRIRR